MDTRPILVVDDEEEMRNAILETLNRKGYATVAAKDGKEALDLIDKGGLRMVISDVRMPGFDGMTLLRKGRERSPLLPFLLITAFGTVKEAVEAVKEGAVDYLLKPFKAEDLLNKINCARAELINDKDASHGLVTADSGMLEILEMAGGVADSDVNVVITGESGTGKELLAKFIHQHSPRNTLPMITVNCASIPDNLLESEMFGHEKGAFTGASHRRTGKFEMANHSTLLLDEIAEMRASLQAKLLRVLQEKEVERVGGDKPFYVDFRVIATTNRNLRKEVTAGRFREDLYYRLNVVPMHLPPLRERLDDISLLVEHFSRQITQRLGMPGKSFSDKALKVLKEQPWRGNIRELKNVIERAVVLSNAQIMDVADLFIDSGASATTKGNPFPVPAKGLRAMEQEVILRTLEEAGGNRSHAARLLGISVRTLRNKLKEYGYSQKENNSDSEDFAT